jgi:hypothetical protein
MWIEGLNTWTTIPLQIVGFGLAIWQIRKAITAAEAAKVAADQAVARVSSNLLLVVLPQLVQAEMNLEWAVAKGDSQVVAHYLGVWRWQAGQARGHLNEDHRHDELRTKIQASIAMAADAKLSLQDPTVDVLKKAKPVQRAIAEVTGVVGELTASGSVTEVV